MIKSRTLIIDWVGMKVNDIDKVGIVGSYLDGNITKEQLKEAFKKDVLLFWYPNLPEDIIRYMVSDSSVRVDWGGISACGTLSQEFISEYMESLNLINLLGCNTLSFDNIVKLVDCSRQRDSDSLKEINAMIKTYQTLTDEQVKLLDYMMELL